MGNLAGVVHSVWRKHRRQRSFREARLAVLFFFSITPWLFDVSSLLAQSTENGAPATDRFIATARRNLRHGTPAEAECTMEMLCRMAEQSRASGQPMTLVRSFAGDLADLAIMGPLRLRGLASHTLALIEPPLHVAVPALSELLRNEDAELRRAAADSFVMLLHNLLDSVGPVIRPASRRELVLAATTVAVAVRPGLNDLQPEVRRRCLETVHLACSALTRLMDEPVGIDDSSTRRTLSMEYEELRPLLTALHDQAPQLERLLQNDDPETRIWTHKVLEELGVARDHWLHRSAARHEQADEIVLAELLYETVPKLAEELVHPDVRVRRSALDVLEMSGTLALPALPALTRAFRDPDRFVRWAAVRTVGKLGPSVTPETRADLTRLLRDPDVDLRKAAATALQKLQTSP